MAERRYFPTSSIVEQHEGRKTGKGQVYAIFVIWQPALLPWYVKNALAALNLLDINVIAVVNHTLSSERLHELQGLSEHVLVRNNAGFDIGGYRDATLFLKSQRNPSRVLYLNDSVYYSSDGLVDLFRRLADSKADIATPFENFEDSYHI